MSDYKRYLQSPSVWLIVGALLCLPLADLSVYTSDPWQQLKRIASGFLWPTYDASLLNKEHLLESFLNTIAFALQGVFLGLCAGFILSLWQQFSLIRSFTAFIRAIHELFWALLFMQLLGLSSLTGVLAIAIPYAGVFAKVFSEQYANVPKDPFNSLPARSQKRFSAFLYSTLPQAWPKMRSYIRYRVECGLRSSAVLGFIGLPTLGFHLQTFFNEGFYSLSALLLYGFIIMVLTMRWWLKGYLLPAYLLAAVVYLPPIASVDFGLLARFFTVDIIPSPLRHADTITAEHMTNTWQWFVKLAEQQMLPGILNTLVLSQIALACTGALSLILFPLVSTHFTNTASKGLGNVILVTLRSTPEYLLTFVGLLLVGPSLLPAIAALSLHTGSIIAHLIGNQSNGIHLREDTSKGANRYFYEILPRIYKSLMALLLYRWEIIMRESAILGILGITTLGFYIDSAFEEFRFDRAILLILVSAILNIGVDRLSNYLRKRSL